MTTKLILACGLVMLSLSGPGAEAAGRDGCRKAYKQLVASLPSDTPWPKGEMDAKSYSAARQVAKHVEKLWAGYVNDDCSEVPSTLRMEFGGQTTVSGVKEHIDSGKYKRVVRGLEFMENDDVEWPNEKVAPVTKQTKFLDKLASPVDRRCLRSGKTNLKSAYCIMNPNKLAYSLLMDEIGELPYATPEILYEECGGLGGLVRRDADSAEMNIATSAEEFHLVRTARATTTTTTTSKWKAPGTCNTTTYYSGMSTYYTCGGNNTCGCLKNITSWSNKCGLGLMPVDGITQVCTGVADTAEPDLTTLNSQMQALGSKCTAQEYLWRLQYVFSSCGSTYTNQSVCDCQAAVSSAQECLTPSEWTLATPNYTVIAPNNVCDLPSWASKNCTKDIYLALATDVFHKCSAYWLTAPNATASAPADSECCASRTLVKTKCGITWDQYTMKPKCATTGKKSSSKKTPTNYPPIPVATPTYHQCSSISSGGGSGMGYSVYCVGLDGSKRYVWEGGMGSGGGFSAFDTSSGIYQGSFNGGGGGGASVYTDVCTQDQYNADLCVENGYMGMGMGGGSASPKPPQSGADINTDSNFKQFNRAFHDALQIINNRRTCPIILISGGGGGGGGYSAASVAEQDAFNWNTGYGFEFEIVLCPGCRPKNTACPTALPY
eukprot:comp22099_c0_seq2/m.32237 comp22099_c0_seq2/g.32237  ORF comp22099_c0_seq2/g.32237 comp22099_c0_seq2/m.32237 type:complete len:662 (-) comp22099_c0_seq2:74-2059(-)